MEARWNSSRLFPYLQTCYRGALFVYRDDPALTLLEPCPSPAPSRSALSSWAATSPSSSAGATRTSYGRSTPTSARRRTRAHHRGRGRRAGQHGDPAGPSTRCGSGTFEGLFNNQPPRAALVGSHPGLMNKPSMRVEGACHQEDSPSSALDSIQAGSSDVALVAGRGQTTVSARVGGDYLARRTTAPARHRRLTFPRCSRAAWPARKSWATPMATSVCLQPRHKNATSTPRLT